MALRVGLLPADEVGLRCRGAWRPASIVGEADGGQQGGVAGLGLGYEMRRRLVRSYLESAEWVRQLNQGYDYTGPPVRGRRGERFLALAWLDQIDEALILVLQDALSSSSVDAVSCSLCSTHRLTRIP